MNQKYTSEEKQAILNRYLIKGEPPSSIIASTGIPKSTFYNWLKTYHENEDDKHNEVSPKNFRQLNNKVARLEDIIEILKTVNCIVKSPLRERLYKAEQLYDKYNVRIICETLDIPRGTFYNHILRNKRDTTWYAKRREELRVRVQEIYDESHQIFGAKKIAAVMQDEGIKVSSKYVHELMQEMGLVSIRQVAKKFYNDEKPKYRNYVNQQFDVEKPNQIWVSDVTYFKYNNTTYYICAIMDLFSRMIISYKISRRNSTQLVKSTFKEAYFNRNPEAGLIFHTDRGSNYRSKTMNDYLQSLNVVNSFSKSHTPYDNSVIETFFSSLKREELYRTKYRSEYDFKSAVDKYMVFYNTKRPHKKLQYKTPEHKEREYYLKNAG